MIRVANISDKIELVRLSVQLGYPVTEGEMENRLQRLLSDPNNAVFVFDSIDGRLAGWVHVFGKLLLELEYAEIGGLVVDSDFRRQGIGEKLMNICEDWAKENGYHEIRLRSGGQRNDAHAFYERIRYENTNWQQVFKKNITLLR
jgi:GNAT superfamily N-acetyltransferase